ncbi:MAG: hypothetical protein ACE5GC_04400, partial [Acidimicrobiia bacterium]
MPVPPIDGNAAATERAMAIERVVVREIAMQLVAPFDTATSTTRDRRIVLIEMHDDAGHTGWGECVATETAHYSPETVDTAWDIITGVLAPLACDRLHTRMTDLGSAIVRSAPAAPMARAAIEMAAWDLLARSSAVSLSSLLGGVRSVVETGVVLGMHGSLDDLARKVIIRRFCYLPL